MSPVPCLIFDLDGTISDPAVGIGRSINHALQHYGYPPIAEEEVSRCIGPPLDDTFRAITGGSSAQVAGLIAKYRERYAAVGYSENVIYPGVPEVLQTLASDGRILGLCTSKRADFAERILSHFGIRRYFHFVNGGDIGVQKEQQLASLLAEQTISPTSTMIGDRAVDIRAAKSNGLESVGVLWGHGSLAELQGASSHALLGSPQDLLQWLTALRPPLRRGVQ